MIYEIHTKASWDQDLNKTWEQSFYPSLVKKLKKSVDYFDDLFAIKIIPLTEISQTESFFELYDKEIGSRPNYLYKQNEQKNLLDERIKDGRKYLLAGLYKKDTNEYSGGIVLSARDKKLIFSLRAIDSNTRSNFRATTTVDFWVEKKIYEYAQSHDYKRLSHGTDNYPNKSRTGLILYKLKVGVKPKIANKTHDVLNLSENDIKNMNENVFFWDNPDENTYFRRANLFYKSNAIDINVLSELTAVLSWAEIEFNKVEI